MELLKKIIQKIKDPHLPPSNELAVKIIKSIVEGQNVYLYSKVTPIFKFGIGRRLFDISATAKNDKFLMMITCTKGLFVYTWGRNCQGVYDLGDPDLITKMEKAINYAR